MGSKNGESSVTELMHNIAYELAKRELNFKEEDKKSQEKLSILSAKIADNQKEVDAKIRALHESIKKQFYGFELPRGTELEIAITIYKQVEENSLRHPSQISTGSDVQEKVLYSVFSNSDITLEEARKMSKKDINRENVDIENTEFDDNNIILTTKDKSLPDFIEPENSKYRFRDDEDRRQEEIICSKQKQINDLVRELLANHGSSQGILAEIERILEETPDGLGIDALGQVLENIAITSANDSANQRKSELEELVSTESGNTLLTMYLDYSDASMIGKTNFNPDQYTMRTKLSLFTHLWECRYIDDSIKEKMKSTEPELARIIEDHSNILKNIRDGSNNIEDANFGEVLLENNRIHSSEEFLVSLTEKINSREENGTDINKDIHASERITDTTFKSFDSKEKLSGTTRLPSKSSEEIQEINKKILLNFYKKKGIDVALGCALKNSTSVNLSKKMQDSWLEAISELLEAERVGTPESIIQNESDYMALREQIKSVASEPSASTYVLRVGQALKNISDRESKKSQESILSAGNVEDIVEHIADGKNMFDGSHEANDISKYNIKGDNVQGDNDELDER